MESPLLSDKLLGSVSAMSPSFIAHEVVPRVVVGESIERGDTAAQRAWVRGGHWLAGPCPSARFGRVHFSRHTVGVGDERLPKARCVLGLGHDLPTRHLDRGTEVLRGGVDVALDQCVPHRRDQRLQLVYFRRRKRTVTLVTQLREFAQARITLRIEEDVVYCHHS